MTKDSQECFNEQENPDRWFYEVQNLTKLLLADDYEEIYRRLDVMLDVISVLEDTRREAGIFFPGDER